MKSIEKLKMFIFFSLLVVCCCDLLAGLKGKAPAKQVRNPTGVAAAGTRGPSGPGLSSAQSSDLLKYNIKQTFDSRSTKKVDVAKTISAQKTSQQVVDSSNAARRISGIASPGAKSSVFSPGKDNPAYRAGSLALLPTVNGSAPQPEPVKRLSKGLSSVDAVSTAQQRSLLSTFGETPAALVGFAPKINQPVERGNVLLSQRSARTAKSAGSEGSQNSSKTNRAISFDGQVPNSQPQSSPKRIPTSRRESVFNTNQEKFLSPVPMNSPFSQGETLSSTSSTLPSLTMGRPTVSSDPLVGRRLPTLNKFSVRDLQVVEQEPLSVSKNSIETDSVIAPVRSSTGVVQKNRPIIENLLKDKFNREAMKPEAQRLIDATGQKNIGETTGYIWKTPIINDGEILAQQSAQVKKLKDIYTSKSASHNLDDAYYKLNKDIDALQKRIDNPETSDIVKKQLIELKKNAEVAGSEINKQIIATRSSEEIAKMLPQSKNSASFGITQSMGIDDVITRLEIARDENIPNAQDSSTRASARKQSFDVSKTMLDELNFIRDIKNAIEANTIIHIPVNSPYAEVYSVVNNAVRSNRYNESNALDLAKVAITKSANPETKLVLERVVKQLEIDQQTVKNNDTFIAAEAKSKLSSLEQQYAPDDLVKKAEEAFNKSQNKNDRDVNRQVLILAKKKVAEEAKIDAQRSTANAVGDVLFDQISTNRSIQNRQELLAKVRNNMNGIQDNITPAELVRKKKELQSLFRDNKFLDLHDIKSGSDLLLVYQRIESKMINYEKARNYVDNLLQGAGSIKGMTLEDVREKALRDGAVSGDYYLEVEKRVDRKINDKTNIIDPRIERYADEFAGPDSDPKQQFVIDVNKESVTKILNSLKKDPTKFDPGDFKLNDKEKVLLKDLIADLQAVKSPEARVKIIEGIVGKLDTAYNSRTVKSRWNNFWQMPTLSTGVSAAAGPFVATKNLIDGLLVDMGFDPTEVSVSAKRAIGGIIGSAAASLLAIQADASLTQEEKNEAKRSILSALTQETVKIVTGDVIGVSAEVLATGDVELIAINKLIGKLVPEANLASADGQLSATNRLNEVYDKNVTGRTVIKDSMKILLADRIARQLLIKTNQDPSAALSMAQSAINDLDNNKYGLMGVVNQQAFIVKIAELNDILMKKDLIKITDVRTVDNLIEIFVQAAEKLYRAATDPIPPSSLLDITHYEKQARFIQEGDEIVEFVGSIIREFAATGVIPQELLMEIGHRLDIKKKFEATMKSVVDDAQERWIGLRYSYDKFESWFLDVEATLLNFFQDVESSRINIARS